MILHVLRQALACIKTFLQLCVSNVASNNNRAGEHHASLDWVLTQRCTNLIHWLIEVDLHDFIAEVVVCDFGKEACRISFESFNEDAIFGDLAQGLAVCAARHSERNRAASAVTR